jgi:hypothetical protein
VDNLGELLGGLFEGIFGGGAEAAPELAADEVSRKLTGEGSLEGASDISPTRYLVGARRVLNVNDL